MYDVVIVGAGPAGSTTAALLARRGMRVALADRSHFPRPKACAEYMSPGVEEILRRTGFERALRGVAPRPVTGMEIVSPSGNRLRIQYQRDGQPVSALTAPRERFDAALVQEAVSSGAELMEGYVVREPIMDGGVVRGVRGSSLGKAVETRAQLTIAADGSRSTLARSLDLSAPARWPVRLGLVAHYHDATDLSHGFGQMHVSAGGYCGVAPLPDGLLNVAMVVPSDSLRRAGLTATAYLERWIASHPALGRLLQRCERVSPVRGVVPLGVRSRRGGLPGALLAGDAAGFFDPFTGEGIHRALRAAELIDELISRNDAVRVGREEIVAYDRMRKNAFRGKEAVTALVQLFISRPVLLDYVLRRLGARPAASLSLSSVLGDLVPASHFLNARTLWSALRP